MMSSTIQVLVLLLTVVAAVAVIANRLKVPPSILLVLTGVLIALWCLVCRRSSLPLSSFCS
jgi:Kef-type K+ transport system membrane component KefB